MSSVGGEVVLWFVFVAEKAVVGEDKVRGDAAAAAAVNLDAAGLMEGREDGEGPSAFPAAVALCSTSACLLFSATLTADRVSFARFSSYSFFLL